jgi:hypothetical protein
MRTGVDIHASDGLPAGDQQADEAVADETGAADHED